MKFRIVKKWFSRLDHDAARGEKRERDRCAPEPADPIPPGGRVMTVRDAYGPCTTERFIRLFRKVKPRDIAELERRYGKRRAIGYPEP